MSFPFLGNMPQIVMGRKKHKRNYDMFQELRRKYGDLFRMDQGSKSMVFIFGPKYIKEVLVEKGQYFINRSNTELAQKLSGNKGNFDLFFLKIGKRAFIEDLNGNYFN